MRKHEKLLLIDNYDSFTYNIVQYLGELGTETTVWRNDKFAMSDVEELAPEAIVISPGPGTPAQAGNTMEVIRRFGSRIPILGVCLGHQAIAQVYGGSVVPAGQVMHGRTSAVQHDGSGIFTGIPSPVTVTRYHSLVTEDIPDELSVNAWTEDDGQRVVMGLRHREHPVWGVQFHPESILSEQGREMLDKFLALRWEIQCQEDSAA